MNLRLWECADCGKEVETVIELPLAEISVCVDCMADRARRVLASPEYQEDET